MRVPVYPGRFTVPSDKEFVLFRIGMRFNGWRGVAAALRTFTAMPAMLAEQQARPELGMLTSSLSLSWPVVAVTQVWRSFEDLEHYASAPDLHHSGAWRWFNKLDRSGLGAGIWHETYKIAPGSYEAVYVNMPRYGLASAIGHEPVTSTTSRARRRLNAETTDAEPIKT